MATSDVTITVNGIAHRRSVEDRMLLSDFLRHEIGLVGTHVGCEHGVCGACTVIIDGRAARSCLTLAVAMDGHQIETIEGVSGPGEPLHPVQQAFIDYHALQCGFCTPGFVMSLVAMGNEVADPTDADIDEAIAGNLCRCTGYVGIRAAAQKAYQLNRSEVER